MPRNLPLALLAFAALALAACQGPCQDLGDRLCRCAGSGTTRDNCNRQVQAELDRLNPGKDVEDLCNAKLDTCSAPQGADFCEWVKTGCGKASCGLSLEDPADPAVCLAPAP